MKSQKCPICNIEVTLIPRYPKYVCSQCATRAVSKHGRPLTFSNVDLSGGYIAHYADSGEEYPSHECYIDNIACHADEARFGGIVIEVI